MRHAIKGLTVVSIIMASAGALAKDAPLHARIGEHLIEEIRSDDAMPRLLMDGKVLVDGANSYRMKLQRSLDGIPAAIIYADTSGASCNTGTSLVVTAKARSVGEVGQVENNGCWTEPKYAVRTGEGGHETFVIQQDPGVSYPGDLWSFSIPSGLHKEADLAYTPEPGTTYADLRHASGQGTPIKLFRNEAFSHDFDKLTGPAKSTILPAVGLTDPAGSIEGRFLIAEGFQPHNAGHQALIAVDLSAQRVFVADYPGEGTIAVYPAVSLWPSPIRRKLAAWAKVVAPPPSETSARR